MRKIKIKVVSVIVLFCMVFSLSACGLDYDSKFVRNDMFFLLDSKTNNYVFSSSIEMKQFLLGIEDKIETELGQQEEQYAEEMLNQFKKFDEEFFETKILILIGIVESSGSNRHKIKSVTVSNNTVTVLVKRITPDIGTCDMAYWQLFLTISKNDFSGNKVQLNIK